MKHEGMTTGAVAGFSEVLACLQCVWQSEGMFTRSGKWVETLEINDWSKTKLNDWLRCKHGARRIYYENMVSKAGSGNCGNRR